MTCSFFVRHYSRKQQFIALADSTGATRHPLVKSFFSDFDEGVVVFLTYEKVGTLSNFAEGFMLTDNGYSR